MAYLKRNKMPKFWPIPRKGTKYLARAMHNQKNSIPLVIILRDILKLTKTKKELKKILNDKKIMINSVLIKETNYPVCLFDVINIPEIKKNYRAVLSENKKMLFEEISEKESETKLFKVIDKKMLKNKKLQINLMGGKNIFFKDKVNTGDSVLLNIKDNKVLKIIPMQEGKNVFVMGGKHTGKKGKIEKIILKDKKAMAKIISDNKKINVLTKSLLITE